MSLQALAEISRFYGGNTEYVNAGGGNTSFKDGDYLWIKASGTSLASAKPEDFVKMKRAALAAIWGKKYPGDSEARESAVLADMMAARCEGEETKRPSVETLLHDLLPFSFVVHTHPALVNGLCCSRRGKEIAAELFPEAIWIPSINPGFILSRAVKEALDLSASGRESGAPVVIFLQNHGIFAAANTAAEIDAVYGRVMTVLGGKIKEKPDFGGRTSSFDGSASAEKAILAAAGKINPGGTWRAAFERNNQCAAFVKDEAAFKPVSSAFTPDHIVYSGSDPLFVNDSAGIENALAAYFEKKGKLPKIIAVKSLGVFGLAESEKAVTNALELFRDTQKIAVFSAAFGGPLFMSEDQINFINNWEVERYRSKIGLAQ